MRLAINRPINGDYFLVQHIRTAPYTTDILNDINYDDYWIYKCTSKQRKATKEDALTMKYAGFIFFKKDLYDKEHIEDWIKYYYDNIDEIKYLNKALPPFGCDKIKIKL